MKPFIVALGMLASQVAHAQTKGVPVPLPALSVGQMGVAERVHVGKMPCELGQAVLLTPDPQNPGYFLVQLQKLLYRMFPIETATGVIRLEDPKAGAVWLQLANKSMLMNTKLGRRLADECQSEAQIAVAQALAQSPPPSLFDAPPVEQKSAP